MRLLRRLLAALLAFAPLPTIADSGPETRASDSVTIRLAQFDVVVRDREGKLVSDLRPDDFEVTEDGRPLDVAAVDAVGFDRRLAAARLPVPTEPAGPRAAEAAEPPPSTREPRSFVLLFDLMNGTTALRFTQAKRAAAAFVRERLAPGDVAVVYSLDLALRAQSGFTNDPDELARAIERIPFMPLSTFADEMAESVLAYRSRASYQSMDERLQSRAVLESERLDWSREHFYRSLADLDGIFNALPGKRVLVVASAGFPMTAVGAVQRERGGFTLQFRELIRTLAKAGVTAYTLDIGDDLAFSDPGKSIDWRIAVGKLGMDENVLSDLGLDAGLGASSTAQRRQVLGVLAAESGGRMLTHGDLARSFRTIDEESTNFYRVSCRVAEREGDATYRRIVVRVRREGTSVVARRGRYGDVVPDLRSEAQKAAGRPDRLDRYAPVSVRATAAALAPEADGRFPVAIVAEVLGPLGLRRDTGGSATLDVDFFAVARAGGEVVARYEKRFVVRVKPEGTEPLSRGFRLEGRLALPAGLYDVQTTVRVDDPPQFGSWSGPVPVHPLPSAPGPRVAAAWLATDGAEEAPLLLRVDAVAGVADPLVLGPGARVLPAAGRPFRRGERILALVWLEGLQVAGGGAPPTLSFDVRLKAGDGTTRPASAGVVAFEPVAASRWRAAIGIDTTGLTPGAWRVEIDASQPAGPEGTATARLEFAIADAPTSSAP